MKKISGSGSDRILNSGSGRSLIITPTFVGVSTCVGAEHVVALLAERCLVDGVLDEARLQHLRGRLARLAPVGETLDLCLFNPRLVEE